MISLEPVRLCGPCYARHRSGHCDKPNRRHLNETSVARGFCDDQSCGSHDRPPDGRLVEYVGICIPKID
jgi:hypothetical protein